MREGRVSLGLSVLPSLTDHSFLHLKREHMLSCYWEQPRPVALRHDPSRPYTEQYRIDAQQFAHLFQLVSPWTCGTHTEILAGRTFRLLDDNVDHLIEFKAFVSCLGMTVSLYCSGLILGCECMNIRQSGSWNRESHTVKYICDRHDLIFMTWKITLQAPVMTVFMLRGVGRGAQALNIQGLLFSLVPRMWWWPVKEPRFECLHMKFKSFRRYEASQNLWGYFVAQQSAITAFHLSISNTVCVWGREV